MRLLIAKVVLLGAIASLAAWYISAIIRWGIRCHYAADYVWGCALLAIITAGCMALAVLCLTRQNLQRVLTSTTVMLVCAAIGCCLGDPLTQGSYDHGFGESEIGSMTGGVLGALFGWGACSIWNYARSEALRETRERAEQKTDTPKEIIGVGQK